MGMDNYELSTRGKQNLETVSRKLVLNRSAELIQNKSMLPFPMYWKAAKEINEICLKSLEKTNELKKKGFDAKDALNVKNEGLTAKIKDLEYHKTQKIPEPCTLNDDTDTFIESDTVSDTDKQNRVYVEARYVKAA